MTRSDYPSAADMRALMTLRTLLTWTRAAMFLALLISGSAALDGFAAAQQPLNVLWLSVEDMSPWIGPYGDRTVPTPHLDAFATESIRYDNAFADSPVCAPARTALITGIYPTRMGAMHMRVRSRSSSDPSQVSPLYEAVPAASVRCFPELLRHAGYYVSNRSKEDYQFNAPAWTWSESSRKADYLNRPEGAPFFSVFNHTGTHESKAFPGTKRRPSAVEEDSVPIPPIYPDTPSVRDALKRTYDNIADMDRWFGRELKRLEEAGLADSTVVFFFSDHGVGLPRGKRSLYGTGTRVPLLVRFPKGRGPADIAPGSSTERIVSFIDFGATVLSLAGIEPDPGLDGRAFLGDFAAEPRELAFFHADRFDGALDRARAVTDGRRLVIRNLLPAVPHLIANAYRERIPMTQDLYDLRDGAVSAWTRTAAQWQTGSTRRPPTEWYDNAEDPWEVRNLAGSAELDSMAKARFTALEGALDQWLVDTADLGLIQPEEAMVREHLWPPDGVQPRTEPPTFVRLADGSWALRGASAGSSMAYRLGEKSPWIPTLPGAPLDLSQPAPNTEDPSRSVEACSHRLGYLPSKLVSLPR